MNTRYIYLLTDIACLAIPFAASFHPAIAFHRQWRFFLLPCILTALFFLVWDAIFVHLHVWGFNKQYLLGPSLLGLPLEEIGFFFCIPYACVFTYYCVKRFVHKASEKKMNSFIGVLGILLLSVAILRYNYLYTSICFSLLGIFLLLLFSFRLHYLGHFFLSFLIILLPFLLSNGVLTGMFTDAPVVWYNDACNLGIRIITIPVEDIFYAMLLLLMNVTGFELLAARRQVRDEYELWMDRNPVISDKWSR